VQVSNLLANKSHDVATISQERTVSDALSLLKERGSEPSSSPVPSAVGRHLQRARRRACPGHQWPRHLKPPSQNLCRPTFRL